MGAACAAVHCHTRAGRIAAGWRGEQSRSFRRLVVSAAEANLTAPAVLPPMHSFSRRVLSLLTGFALAVEIEDVAVVEPVGAAEESVQIN